MSSINPRNDRDRTHLHYAGMLQKWRGRQRVLTDIQQSAEAPLCRLSSLWARVYPPLLPMHRSSFVPA